MSEEACEMRRPRWLDWVEKNAGPKRRDYPRPKRELSRWQKRGPMTRRDWVRFYHWAAKNAMPREIDFARIIKCLESPEKGDKKKKKKTARKTFDQLLETANKLSVPKRPRKKYVYPPKPSYPYNPQIHVKKPALRERGRPVIPPKVPRWFHHIDLEAEFWAKLRFPLNPSTRKYVPSPNVLRLAEPRTLPDPPHCPIPEKVIEEPPPRRRMNYRQWREHLRRLEYLAKPTSRPYCTEDEQE